MKASELKINNLIYFPNIETKESIRIPSFEARIVCINEITVFRTANGILIEELISSCVPIQLTGEWLLKFGFKKRPYDEYIGLQYIIHGSVFEIVERITMTYSMFYFMLKDDVSCKTNLYWKEKPIEFVHQLQNLYFYLTGKELEIK